jgi:hypothetical protein
LLIIVGLVATVLSFRLLKLGTLARAKVPANAPNPAD